MMGGDELSRCYFQLQGGRVREVSWDGVSGSWGVEGDVPVEL